MTEITGHNVASSPGHLVTKEPAWVHFSDEQLLDVRMCDLGVEIKGTVLEERIQQLYKELKARKIRHRPHCWLSNEWFSPDGIPGIAIPFYLAHPRLMKLEHHQMLEVEGGTHEWCMLILRHEAGHTIDTAYRLHRRRRWQRQFGKSSKPYPRHYQPRPYSKSYVLHLDLWYAQSHPSEDFAETFAVWMRPATDWRSRYAGWPALKKLEYVDEIMTEIANIPPIVRSRQRVEPLSELNKTLREHYMERRDHYVSEDSTFYDRDLRRLFSSSPEHSNCESASAFLRRIGRPVRRIVAYWTHEYQYTVDKVLEEIINRCNELGLRRHRSEEDSQRDVTVLLAVQVMNYVQAGNHRLAL